jgi:hypothetical protein
VVKSLPASAGRLFCYKTWYLFLLTLHITKRLYSDKTVGFRVKNRYTG